MMKCFYCFDQLDEAKGDMRNKIRCLSSMAPHEGLLTDTEVTAALT